MNSSKTLLVVLIATLIPALSFAYDFKEGGLCYNINKDGKTVTMTYENLIMFAFDAPAPTEKGYKGKIIIPETIKHNGKTYKVTAVDRGTFSCNTDLISVVMPKSVKNIGKETFMHCPRLKEVILPPSLTEISDYMFAESGLQTINIPENVKAIGNYAFASSSLKSITIPSSVKTIGQSAFSGCRWMNEATMSNNVESIGEAAFSICPSLKTIHLSSKLKEIGSKAFYECSGLEEITIPASVVSIGDGAFSNCHGLKSIKVQEGNSKYDSRDNCNAIIETATNTLIAGCDATVIPYSVIAIEDEAFVGCNGFKSIEIPTSVKTIGSQAFFYCKNIKELNIPNSVISIEERAFCGCDSLETVVIANSVKSIGYGVFLHDDHIKTVTIGSGVTSIGGWAFKGLDSVKSITSKIENPSSVKMGENVFDEIDKKACTLYVPRGTAASYKEAPQWKDFKNIVEQ